MDIADPDARHRVAQAVRGRRHALGLTQAEVTAAGGPSKAVLYQLEHGKPKGYRDALVAGLEGILGWAPGSLAAVARGERPVELDDQSDGRPGGESSGASGDGDAARAIEINAHGYRVTLYPNPDKTPEEIHEALQRVIGAILRVDPST